MEAYDGVCENITGFINPSSNIDINVPNINIPNINLRGKRPDLNVNINESNISGRIPGIDININNSGFNNEFDQSITLKQLFNGNINDKINLIFVKNKKSKNIKRI